MKLRSFPSHLLEKNAIICRRWDTHRENCVVERVHSQRQMKMEFSPNKTYASQLMIKYKCSLFLDSFFSFLLYVHRFKLVLLNIRSKRQFTFRLKLAHNCGITLELISLVLVCHKKVQNEKECVNRERSCWIK